MRKVVAVLAILFVGFTFSKVSFVGGIRSSNVEPSLKSNDVWGDAMASKRSSLVGHAVKIQENVKFKDIEGNEDSVDDATSGSGAVIAVDEDLKLSLILTANHVCQPSFPVGTVVGWGSLIITETKTVLTTVEGKKLDVEIVYSDPESDVCVMEAKGIAGVPAVVGAFHPPIGGRVLTTGAPMGIWDKGVVSIQEGLFEGEKEEDICVPGQCFSRFLQHSIPIIGGMSGSAVYYKGRIIGLLTVGTSSYEHVAWGPGLGPIRRAMEAVQGRWDKQRDELDV